MDSNHEAPPALKPVIEYIGYKDLSSGMYVMTKHGRRINKINIVCSDRIVYTSILTNKTLTCKLLKAKDKMFIDMTRFMPGFTDVDDLPF